MERNKRSADYWPTSKKPCPDHVNMLRPGKDPNQFMVACLLDASKDIMKHVTKEAERIKEFYALDLKRKEVVLKNVSDMIYTRCNNIMLNKIVCGEKHTAMLYFKTYPKGRGLDEEIMRILMDTQNPDKRELKSSTSNCPTSESSSDKILSKESTSNCPTSESSSDKIESKESTTSNCSTLESNKISVPNNIINNPNPINMLRKEPNKRSSDDWPTFESKKSCTDHVNMLRAGKDPNQFMVTCLRDASKDIMKHVTKEAEKVKEFKALDVKQKDLVLKKISDKIFIRCYDVMLNKIVCGEKHTTMLYYKTYPKGSGLDEEIMKILSETPNNSCSDKMESKCSTSNCPTPELSSDKIESKGNTSNCPTFESNSDKILSKGTTSNCPASKSSSDKIESKGSSSNCPTSESNSDKIESKGSTSNCPTSESNSDEIETKGSTSNCPASESNSDKIESKGSTSNCPTSELNSDKIRSKGCTNNCPTLDSSSNKIVSKGSTSNCPTSELNSDKIESKGSTSNCPTSELNSDKIESKGSTSNCPTPESNSDKIESKGSTSNCPTSESSSDKIESKGSTDNRPTLDSSSEKIESKGRPSNCPTSESSSDTIESKGCTNNCPTLDSSSDKIELKGSTSNCPTSELNSDKIESKGSTSNCPTTESSSDTIESKGSTNDCPTLDSSSDKIELKESTSNCPTSELNSDKIRSKRCTNNCPTLDSSSNKIVSKGSTSNCPTSESNSDKIVSKGSTSNCPTSESSSDKIESKGSTNDCPTLDSSSDKIELKESTSNCPTSESSSDKIESKGSTNDCPTLDSSSDKNELKESTSNCSTSESNSDKIESKSSISNCPTSDSNKIWISNYIHGNHLNMLTPETNLNSFELTCLQESVTDIMKHINQEAVKMNEFNALDVKQKHVVLKKVSDVIFTRCQNFKKNKVIDSYARILKIYFTKFPKYKGLDEQIQKMLTEVPNHPSLYEFVDFGVLPQAEQINKIFCDKIDTSVEECFKKMITNIKNYEDEKDIFQCIDELPSIEDIDNESDKLDKSVDSTVGNDIEGLNDLNKVKSHESTVKCDTEVLTDLNKVIDDYEPERKKLKEYYKIIDWFLVPKIEDLLESYKTEFREILKNDKEYVVEATKITCQLWDEFDKPIKVKQRRRQKRRCLIECKLEANENDDDDKEINSENDDMGEEMNSENVDMVEEINSENVDMVEEINSENDDMVEEMNSQNVDMVEELNAQNVDMVEQMNSQNDDMVEQMNSENVDMVEEMNAQNVDMVEEMNSQNDDMVEQVNSENNDDIMDEKENSENNDNKGHDNDRNEDEKERERNSLLHLNSNVMTQPDPVYRVKLISMPDLPSKELILQFLNQFNTKAIKKHKTLKNLLVIDLNTENDYNNILKACGTKIGPHKLLIRSNETNDSDIKENNEKVNTQTVEKNSVNIPEIVQVFNQGGDKISDERDRNNVVRKHVIKQVPNDGRDKNSEISDKVIKQEPNDELTDVRLIKAEKEADGEKVDEKIENREIYSEIASVSTSQEVDIDNSQFVAKLCATPVLPEKEAIAYFIKKYNPTAIKKHKKFDNILLVTFNNKNDYEKFLSMDGHRINRSELTIVKVHQIEKSLKKPNVAKEQTKGSNKEHVSNDEIVDGSKMNNEKVLDSQKTVASAINTINKEKKCLKETTNNKLEFSTVATVEHEIKNTTNDKTLDERTALNNNTKEVNCQKTVASTINFIDEDIKCPKEPTNSKTEQASVIDIKEREIKNGLNDKTLDDRTTLNNNNKVVSSQKPVENTINTIEKVCTEETIGSKTNPATAETVIDINKEHNINKVSNDETSDEGTKMNVDTRLLDKQNEIDTKEHEINIKDKEIESNINSEAKTDNIYTPLDNIIIKTEIKTEKIDDYENINSEPDIDCNVIHVKKEDILEIKQEIAEASDEVIVKESNIQLGLKNLKMEIDEDNTNIVVNNQNVGSEQDIFLTSEKFHPTLKIDNSNNTGDMILCENELKEHLGANLKEIVIKKITETFSKIEKINKESNFELLNCKELEDGKLNEHTKELIVKTDVNKTKSNDETQITEDTFFKKLNVLRDNILTVLNQDDEYITIKSTITEKTKSLRK